MSQLLILGVLLCVFHCQWREVDCRIVCLCVWPRFQTAILLYCACTSKRRRTLKVCVSLCLSQVNLSIKSALTRDFGSVSPFPPHLTLTLCSWHKVHFPNSCSWQSTVKCINTWQPVVTSTVCFCCQVQDVAPPGHIPQWGHFGYTQWSDYSPINHHKNNDIMLPRQGGCPLPRRD